MIYTLQILYVAFNIASTVLDYFIYSAFVKEEHHRTYLEVSEYTDYAEAALCVFLAVVGLLAEVGSINTAANKSTWLVVVKLTFAVMFIESVSRIFCMSMAAIHIHPGKLDFMGLFLLILLFYYILKLVLMMQLAMGLIAQIDKITVTTGHVYLPVSAAASESSVVYYGSSSNNKAAESLYPTLEQVSTGMQGMKLVPVPVPNYLLR